MPGANPAGLNLGSNRYKVDGNVYRTTDTATGGGGYTPPTNAVHQWKMDEGTGSTLTDSIGTADATLNGGPTWNTSENWIGGTGLSLDGVDDYGVVPYSAEFDVADFCVMATVQTSVTEWDDRIVDIYNGSTSGWRLNAIAPGNTDTQFSYVDTTASGRHINGPSVNDGQPHRVVGNVNNGTWELWIDGSQVGGTNTDPYQPCNGSLDLWIGMNQQGGDRHFEGVMDNLVFCDGPLSPQQIQEDYYAQPWAPDPPPKEAVLHLDAQSISGATDGGAVTSWTDQSSYGVTLNGSATYRATGLNGNPSLEFMPVNDDGFEGTMGFSLAQAKPNTVLAVLQLQSPTDGVPRRIVRTATDLTSTSTDRNHVGKDGFDNNWRTYAGDTYRADPVVPGTPVLLAVEMRDGTHRPAFRENGQKLAYMTGQAVNMGAEDMGPAVAIGKQMGAAEDEWNGHIGEIRILNHADPSTVVQAEQDMANRWGISTPTFQYEEEFWGAHAHQSVVSDGSHLYTSTQGHDPEDPPGLYKMTKDGYDVDFRADHFADGTTMTQVCDMFWNPDDGLIYGAANNYNSANPDESWVKVWDPSDMSYVTEHSVPNNGLAEGVFKAHGSWWLIYANSSSLTEMDLNWTHVADHPFAYSADQTDGNSYNGMHWEGNFLYTTRHNGKTPQVIEVHEWDGATLTAHSRIEKPHPDATQGMAKEPGQDIMWFAARGADGYGAANDNVVKTRFSHTNGAPDGF